MSEAANPDDVASWAQSLNLSFLSCRDYGHSWRPLVARRAETSYERVQRCVRCRTERTQTLSLMGRPLGAHYDYADGYLAPTGQGRLGADSRGVVRVESILRLIEKSGGTSDEG